LPSFARRTRLRGGGAPAGGLQGLAASQTFIQVDNTVYALNANTGATIWTTDIGQYGTGQPVAEDGVVVAASDSGFGFDRNDVGTVFAFSDPDAT
jgi:outer membrane protein assembly factor BamB